MGKKPHKLLRLKFHLTQEQEGVLWQYINRTLLERESKVETKHAQRIDNSRREDVRIRFRDKHPIVLTSLETSLVPEQIVQGELVDLSIGGCAMAVNASASFAKNGKGFLRISFTRPLLEVSVTIMGVK